MESESSCESPLPSPPPPDAASHPESSSPSPPSSDPPPASAPHSTDEDHPVNHLSDDLRDKIVRQVEYYFSDENLPTDKFLLKQMKRDKKGYVPIALVASFRKMKKLAQDLSLVEAALRTSSELIVSSDGKKVKRLNPLPINESNDTKPQTVLVENLPEDYSMGNLQKIFENIGKVNNITICDPHQADESANNRKGEMGISSKLHALIEYKTVEAAERAAATLNDDKNWRTGLRVELLCKRMGKYRPKQRGHKGTFSEKNCQALDAADDGEKPKAVCDNVETAEKEDMQGEEHFTGEKAGGRGRSKSWGRGQLQQNSGGHGWGFSSNSSSEVMSKPLPGPRMPDGTRGFTIGRGKPSTQNCYQTDTLIQL